MHRALSSGPLVLRPVGAGDMEAVAAVLADPTVARWWGDYDLARVQDEFGTDGDGVRLVIEFEGRIAGIIQYSEESDPDYRHAALDLALSESFQGRGIGPSAIRLLVAYLFDDLGHHRLTIDPAADNRNAIRAYESVGFRTVGVMRQYERGVDGTWHDGLLMELLRDDFAR